MTPEELLEKLRASEEPRGRYLHADREHCLETAQSLLDNLERYGYLCCPCRLACGDAVKDDDIVCPCEYNAQDLQEYGTCYCTLFVTEEYRENADHFPEMDDRRPPDKGA